MEAAQDLWLTQEHLSLPLVANVTALVWPTPESLGGLGHWSTKNNRGLASGVSEPCAQWLSSRSGDHEKDAPDMLPLSSYYPYS